MQTLILESSDRTSQLFLRYLFLIYVYIYLCEDVCAQGVQRRVMGAQALVSHPTGVLGVKLGSCARAADALN